MVYQSVRSVYAGGLVIVSSARETARGKPFCWLEIDLMMGLKPIARTIAALMLIAAMTFGLHGSALAQDSGTPVVSSGDSVSVTCSYDSGVDESTCDFTLNDVDGLAPAAFTIGADQLCGSPTSTGTATSDGSGNLSQDVVQNGLTATLTFAGSVTAVSGGGSYQVESDGETIAISGDSIDCSGGGSSAGDPGQAATVTATINFFDCTADPGDVAPGDSALCSPSVGVAIAVTVDGVPAGIETSDGSGVATVDAPDGSSVQVVEDQTTIPVGYSPYGDGVINFTAAVGLERTFVHLPTADLGRMQIISGTCPTSGDSGTVFRVIEPGPHLAAANSCAATGNVPFVITGGALGAGLAVGTGDDGNWRGFLPAGDYVITSADSVTADLTIYNEDITVVVAINYVAQPTGSLSIKRWECSSDPNAQVTIDVSETAPDDPADCTPSNGYVTLTEVGSSADPAELLMDNGAASIELKPASYVLTDETSGETASFEIAAGQTLYATIIGGPADDGSGGSAGNGTDGNGTGNGSDGNGTGNGSDGNGTGDGNGSTDGGGNGGDTGGDSSGTGDGSVTTLPDTGIHQPAPADSLPLGGAAAMLALVIGAAYVQRRRGIGGR
jgi:hypothetical protein